MKTFFRTIFFYVNAVFAVALLLSYLAPFINPKLTFIPAFLGLAYPLLLYINIVFFVCWIYFLRWHFLVSLLAILIGWNHVKEFIQISKKTETEQSESTFKVMSYNVRLFDLYNWSNNKKTRNKIFNVIDEENADILCLQEFYYDKTNNFNTLDTLVKFQDARQVHTAYTTVVQNKYYFGIATFSKYKIINRGKIKFKSTNNIAIYTDVIIQKDTIRIYNNHLESNHFQKKNYNFIDSLAYINDNKNISGVNDLIYRLKNGFIKRANQVDIISDHIKHSPYPVIVCGDFNDTPLSYAYHKMKNLLKDSFMISGNGFGKTYKRKLLHFRIDYILFDNTLELNNFNIIKRNFSDHYPLVSVFSLN